VAYMRDQSGCPQAGLFVFRFGLIETSAHDGNFCIVPNLLINLYRVPPLQCEQASGLLPNAQYAARVGLVGGTSHA